MTLFANSYAQTLDIAAKPCNVSHRRAATLAEMYAYAFHIQNTQQRKMLQSAQPAQSNSGNRSSTSRASLQTNPEASLQTRLQITDAQYRAFRAAAQRFAPSDNRITRQMLALSAQDRATHPSTRILTGQTGFEIDQLVQQRISAAAEEVSELQQALSVDSVHELTNRIVALYSGSPRSAVATRPHPEMSVRSTDPGTAIPGLDEAECLEEGYDWNADFDACYDFGNGDGDTDGGGGGGAAPLSPSDTTPIVTGIEPSVWSPGTTAIVNFSGQYFGTDGPTLSFFPSDGIRYSLISYDDSSIVASVNVAPGTPNEDIAVTITNNGYGGLAFYGGSSGQSASSAPAYASVQSPANSQEVTVIAWVNASAVSLPSGENPVLEALLNNSTAAQSLSCATEVGLWSTLQKGAILTSRDVSYANAWLVKNSGNNAPPDFIVPASQASLGDFRLFNDFGKSKGIYKVGITPDPCKTGLIPDWVEAGQPYAQNGATGTSPSGMVYQLAEGRIGPIGQAVNITLNATTTPWIWSVVEFDPSGNPQTINHAIFPTYSVYYDGVLRVTYPQSPLLSFTSLNGDTSQLNTSEIP